MPRRFGVNAASDWPLEHRGRRMARQLRLQAAAAAAAAARRGHRGYCVVLAAAAAASLSGLRPSAAAALQLSRRRRRSVLQWNVACNNRCVSRDSVRPAPRARSSANR